MMIKKGLTAGAVLLVIGLGINQLVGVLLPTIGMEYQNTAIFRPWSDPLMMVYFAYPFILGIVAAYLWGRIGKPKPFEFAKLYFWIATLPGMFITYTSFQVSLSMVLLWAFTGFVQAFAAGWVFTKIK